MVTHTKLILTLSSLSNNTKLWLSVYLKRQIASLQYNSNLSFFSSQGESPSRRMFVGYPLQHLCPHNPTIFSPAPMLMTGLFPVPTPTLIRWLSLFLLTRSLLKRGWMNIFGCFKVHQHCIHPSICAIQHSSSIVKLLKFTNCL